MSDKVNNIYSDGYLSRERTQPYRQQYVIPFTLEPSGGAQTLVPNIGVRTLSCFPAIDVPPNVMLEQCNKEILKCTIAILKNTADEVANIKKTAQEL